MMVYSLVHVVIDGSERLLMHNGVVFIQKGVEPQGQPMVSGWEDDPKVALIRLGLGLEVEP